MKTFKTMLKTELKLSLRGMDMVIFAICVPLVVLVILGIIYGDKPAFEGAGYSFLEQSFGALAAISICAGGVMGLPLVISDYRSRKILKRYQVTPVSPAMLLFVQVTIYTLYAVVSLLLRPHFSSDIGSAGRCSTLPEAICWCWYPCSASACWWAGLPRIPKWQG